MMIGGEATGKYFRGFQRTEALNGQRQGEAETERKAGCTGSFSKGEP